MERDIAIRLDGMLMNIIGSIDGTAHYMKNNLSEDEYKIYINSIACSMGALSDTSRGLHTIYPDTTPK